MRWSLIGGIAGLVMGAGVALAAEEVELPERHWSFDGFFGTFERDDVRRGYEVYRTVCAGCHGLSLIRYRELAQIGYSEDEIKALAAEQTYTDGPSGLGLPRIPSSRPSPTSRPRAWPTTGPCRPICR
jgi:ubiquinol-cytochrome c reductase cytochrome c1 subunit